MFELVFVILLAIGDALTLLTELLVISVVMFGSILLILFTAAAVVVLTFKISAKANSKKIEHIVFRLI